MNSFIKKYSDLSVSLRSIILLVTDKSQYFAKLRPIIVNYCTLNTTYLSAIKKQHSKYTSTCIFPYFTYYVPYPFVQLNSETSKQMAHLPAALSSFSQSIDYQPPTKWKSTHFNSFFIVMIFNKMEFCKTCYSDVQVESL